MGADGASVFCITCMYGDDWVCTGLMPCVSTCWTHLGRNAQSLILPSPAIHPSHSSHTWNRSVRHAHTRYRGTHQPVCAHHTTWSSAHTIHMTHLRTHSCHHRVQRRAVHRWTRAHHWRRSLHRHRIGWGEWWTVPQSFVSTPPALCSFH